AVYSVTMITIISSSKPVINYRQPISKELFSALPPSKASPSINPSKSITTVSPFSTVPSSFRTSSAWFSRKFSRLFSTSSSVTSTSSASYSKPLYSPSLTSGLTVTIALKINSFPFQFVLYLLAVDQLGKYPFDLLPLHKQLVEQYLQRLDKVIRHRIAFQKYFLEYVLF